MLFSDTFFSSFVLFMFPFFAIPIAQVTKEIQAVADMCCSGRVVSVLEGGYGCQSTPSKNYSKPGSFGHRRAPATSSAAANAATTSSSGGSGSGDQLLQLNAAGEPVGATTGAGAGAAAGAAASAVAATLRESLDRTHLVNAACAHVRALVDPYGHVKPETLEHR